MRTYQIKRLHIADFSKCNNVWDIEENRNMANIFFNELVSGNRITFVYLENDEILGEGSLVFKNDDPDYTIPGKRVYLSRMIVKTGHHNRGIGSRILDYLINHAEQLGYEEIALGVDIANGNARHLYEKEGFTEVLYSGEDEYGEYIKLLKKL